MAIYINAKPTDNVMKEVTFGTKFKEGGNGLKYKMDGGNVYFFGQCKTAVEIPTTDNWATNIITTLPAAYRPKVQKDFICQSGDQRRFLCTFRTDGIVAFSRYGDGATNNDCLINTMLNFSCIYPLD